VRGIAFGSRRDGMKTSNCIPALIPSASLILLVAALAGCGAMGGGTRAGGGMGASSGSAAAAGMSQADQKMITDIAQANIAEIQTGRLALTKSQNPQVRAFAQQMINDHTMALQDLQRLAQGMGTSLPGDTDLKHKAVAAELGILSGDTFDRQYLSQVGVADHKRTQELVEQTARSASSPALRAYAQKILPVVSHHLEQAQRQAGRQ
jgi:putative membrane protein